MRNTHGSFIWYELLTSDPDAAANFYGSVIGWSAAGAGQPAVDYRIFSADGTGTAGHMKIPADAADAGMRPMWLGYIGVDDVDDSVASVTAAGGSVQMPAMDLEGVGRIAMIADPQGAPFYVMRGAVDQPSTSFGQEPGHCAWNELSTRDAESALDFYTGRFGWAKGDTMPMGEMGDYQFINHDGEMIGAMMPLQDDARPRWNFYFQVADIDLAVGRTKEGGGAIQYGPVEIPGGEFAAIANDPQGAVFGIVGPRRN